MTASRSKVTDRCHIPLYWDPKDRHAVSDDQTTIGVFEDKKDALLQDLYHTRQKSTYRIRLEDKGAEQP